MVRFHSLAVLLIAAFLGAVSGLSEQSDGNLVFENRQFSRSSSGCATDVNQCIKIEIEYPVAVKGPRKALQTINDTIDLYVRQSLAFFPVDDTHELPTSLDEIADRLVADYEEFSKERSTPWTIETKGEVLFQNKNLVAISLDNFSYTGGAHPNSFRILVNFDAKNGKVIKLEDVVTDVEKLKVILEAKFREHHDLSKDANLNEEGFFWDSQFSFPANFAVQEDGLLFYYNPYEVAAYVVGSTEVLVPFKAMKDILAKKMQ